MKYAILAASFAIAASFGSSAQAAPVALGGLKLEAITGDAVQKVWHCRRWSGGWGCGRGWRRDRYHRQWTGYTR
jgi:hypothetical protein